MLNFSVKLYFIIILYKHYRTKMLADIYKVRVTNNRTGTVLLFFPIMLNVSPRRNHYTHPCELSTAGSSVIRNPLQDSRRYYFYCLHVLNFDTFRANVPFEQFNNAALNVHNPPGVIKKQSSLL